jgi:hypothetical protein
MPGGRNFPEREKAGKDANFLAFSVFDCYNELVNHSEDEKEYAIPKASRGG